MSKDKVRVAVVGLGKMGWLHASILNVLPDADLVAVCEKALLIRRLSKKLFKKAQVVNDVHRLSGLDIDTVYVTTPIGSHSTVAGIIYSNGIADNLFVEKTLAASYAQAEELCEKAKQSGGANMVGYMKRFAVTFRKAEELLKEDVLGKVTSFEAYAYSSDFPETDERLKASMLRGGVLRDLGCHAIDIALWFFGDLQLDSVNLQSTGQSSVHIGVSNAQGLKGAFDMSQSMKDYRMPEIGVQVKGSKGNLSVNDDRLTLQSNDGKSSVWYRHNLNDNVFFRLGESEYFRESEHFINSVLEKHDATPDFQTASKVDQLIDQINAKLTSHDQ